jgi:hypothetical protein
MDNNLDIYKMAVEMADRVSSRRLSANAFFLSVNTALTGLMALAYNSISSDHRFVLYLVSAVGLLLSATWFFAIRSYKRLNKAKFDVIQEMEKALPEQYFTKEWDALQRSVPKDPEPRPLRDRWLRYKDRYTDLTSIEAVVPIAFALIYIAFLIMAIARVGVK